MAQASASLILLANLSTSPDNARSPAVFCLLHVVRSQEQTITPLSGELTLLLRFERYLEENYHCQLIPWPRHKSPPHSSLGHLQPDSCPSDACCAVTRFGKPVSVASTLSVSSSQHARNERRACHRKSHAKARVPQFAGDQAKSRFASPAFLNWFSRWFLSLYL